jgi:siroheme synthase
MDATTPDQRVWTGELAALGVADVESPAVIVIGAVAAFADAAVLVAASRTISG